jgi:galactitol-specific phosphotransferase system IIC component
MWVAMKINKNTIGTVIVSGFLIFLYFHRVLNVYLYTGQWHFNLYGYYREYLGKDMYPYFLLIVLFAILSIRIGDRLNKKNNEAKDDKLGR